ncbi:Estrogen receptor [Ancistrocladus abbreviatus]
MTAPHVPCAASRLELISSTRLRRLLLILMTISSHRSIFVNNLISLHLEAFLVGSSRLRPQSTGRPRHRSPPKISPGLLTFPLEAVTLFPLLLKRTCSCFVISFLPPLLVNSNSSSFSSSPFYDQIPFVNGFSTSASFLSSSCSNSNSLSSASAASSFMECSLFNPPTNSSSLRTSKENNIDISEANLNFSGTCFDFEMVSGNQTSNKNTSSFEGAGSGVTANSISEDEYMEPFSSEPSDSGLLEEIIRKFFPKDTSTHESKKGGNLHLQGAGGSLNEVRREIDSDHFGLYFDTVTQNPLSLAQNGGCGLESQQAMSFCSSDMMMMPGNYQQDSSSSCMMDDIFQHSDLYNIFAAAAAKMQNA